MEPHEAIRRARHGAELLIRTVDPQVVDCLLRAALRSPTAGNTGGTAWVALEGDEQTARYWEVATDQAWRRANPGRFEGLRRAPVVLLAYACPLPTSPATRNQTRTTPASAPPWSSGRSPTGTAMLRSAS